MTNICLFGGPNTGKSTTASGVFNKMKKSGYKIEFLTEYAKDLTYSKSHYRLSDQLYILAKQHHPWFVLKEQMDYTINDGPFLLGLVYLQDLQNLPQQEFKNLVLSMYKSYSTINIFIERDLNTIEYQEYGRNQSLEEAMELDDKIRNVLIENNIPYYRVKISNNIEDEIIDIILNHIED